MVSSLLQANTHFSHREGQIAAALGVNSPDKILGKINKRQLELSRAAKLRDALPNILGCSRNSESINQVSQLHNENAELQSFVAKVL